MDAKIIRQIRSATCSVGKMSVRHEDLPWLKVPGAPVSRPDIQVFGTAFLIERGCVLTNRHIVEAIANDCMENNRYVPTKMELWYLTFTYPDGKGGLSESYQRITSGYAFNTALIVKPDPSAPGNLDVGLLSYTHTDGDMIDSHPVTFGDLSDIIVGKEIAICGFPLGSELLTQGKLNRFGAVIHRGIISAVAPYDQGDPRAYTAILTDLNTAGGMSGSPIFFPETGEVIGLHFGGCPGTLGLAQPLDEPRVKGWIDLFQKTKGEGAQAHQTYLTPSGDIKPALVKTTARSITE